MACVPLSVYKAALKKIPRKNIVKIDTSKERTMRFDFREITTKQIVELAKGTYKTIPKELVSLLPAPIQRRLGGILSLSNKQRTDASNVIDLLDSNDAIPRTIALHEIMESIKGEVDKAGNMKQDISKVSDDGVLPNIPLARVAAVIGRRIMVQKGYVFKSTKDTKTTKGNKLAPKYIEHLYYQAGMSAIKDLETEGFIKLPDKEQEVLKDFIESTDETSRPSTKDRTTKVKVLSLNTEKLTGEALTDKELLFFTDRAKFKRLGSKTKLSSISTILRTTNYLLQPSNITFPEKTPISNKDNPHNFNTDSKTILEGKDALSSNPLYINQAADSFFIALNEAVIADPESSALSILSDIFQDDGYLTDLFGIKAETDYSIDKTESVQGQNLSNSKPFEDLIEYYEALTDDTQELYMAYKNGRNARGYIDNSIANPHTDKNMRKILTITEYEIDPKVDLEAYQRFIFYFSSETGYTPDEVMGVVDNSELDAQLTALNEFKKATKLEQKVAALTRMQYSGDKASYSSLIADLQGIQDIRDALNSDGVITTSQIVSSDATGSGGTLTLLDALGTSDNITTILEDLGILSVNKKLDDIYGILSQGIQESLNLDFGLSSKSSNRSSRVVLKSIINKVYKKTSTSNLDKAIRELSKSGSMTFIYGQGKYSSKESMATDITNEIFKNLRNKSNKELLKELGFEVDDIALTEVEGLYNNVRNTLLEDNGVVDLLYKILDKKLNKDLLNNFNKRKVAVFNLIEKYAKESKTPLLIMPAGAVMDNVDLTVKNLKKYGIPLEKVQTVARNIDGDTVFTQEPRPTMTTLGVNTIHGKDTYLQYSSIAKGLKGRDNESGISIHDDFRGSPQAVNIFDEEYVKRTYDVTRKYDVHEQALLAAAIQNPSIIGDPEFQTLMDEIAKSKELKQETLKSFNFTSDSIIGDGSGYKSITVPKAKGSIKPKPLNKLTTMEILTELSQDSDVISSFAVAIDKLGTKVKIDNKSGSMFDPATNTITLSTLDSRGIDDVQRKWNTKSGRKAIKEILEHEITHSFITAWVEKQVNLPPEKRDIEYKYTQKAYNKVFENHAEFVDSMPESYAKERLRYIFTEYTDKNLGLNEFITIMYSEPKVADEVYRALVGNKTLLSKFKAFINSITKTVSMYLTGGPIQSDLNLDLDVEKLYISINNTVVKGFTYKSNNPSQAKLNEQKVVAKLGVSSSTTNNIRRGYIDALNRSLYVMINSRLERKVVELGKTVDVILTNTFPVYTTLKNRAEGIYNTTGALQQLNAYITGTNIGKIEKNKLLAFTQKVKSDRAEFTSTQLAEFTRLTSKFSKDDKQLLHKFVTKVNLADYFLLSENNKTTGQVDARITELESILDKNTNDLVNTAVNINVYSKIKNNGKERSLYNLSTKYGSESTIGKQVRELVALKSIKELGVDALTGTLDNNIELANLIKDNVISLYLLNKKNGNTDLRVSGVNGYFKEPIQIKVFNEAEASKYDFSDNTGWKIGRDASNGELGFAYKYIIDSTYIEGAFTDIQLASTDINIPDGYNPGRNSVQSENGFKLVITDEERQNLGIVEDGGHALIKSVGHAMAIDDTMETRNMLIRGEQTAIVSSKVDGDNVVNLINDKEQDHPWFLKLEGVKYKDLDPKIQARYEPAKGASNVKDFNKQVSLVRKDIKPWLMGDKMPSLASNPKLKVALRVTKNLISMAKMKMVLLNPAKIALDAASTTTYLSVMGMSPLEISSSFSDTMKKFDDFTNLRAELVKAKIKATAYPNNKVFTQKYESVRKELSSHEMSVLVNKGFINSLGSDLINQNIDTTTGLQADIRKSLEYILKDKNGNDTKLAKAINQLNKVGVNGEDTLGYIGKRLQKYDATSDIGKEVRGAADRVTQVKTQNDAIRYVEQFLVAPDAETTKFGVYMNDMIDVLGKKAYYDHLVKKGYTEDEATVKVIEAFPDYKENMPISVKQLGDYGVLLFPSYWLRIQKVIYRMVIEKPLSLSAELEMASLMNTHLETILDASVYTKVTTGNGLVNNPADNLSLWSVLPIN